MNNVHDCTSNDHLPLSSVEFISNDLRDLVEEMLVLESPAAAGAGPVMATAAAPVLPSSPTP